MASCTVFGHRVIKEYLDKEKLKLIFIDLIQNKQVDIFYFGGFGEFDDMCYQIISELKCEFPLIKRIYCLEDEKFLRKSKRPKWLQEENYEDYIYLDLKFDWWYQRIYYRNCAMIEQSDFIVFYIRNTENSGAFKALQYANRLKKNIIKV